MKYIDADKLKAEIERQIALLPTVGYSTQIAGDYIPVQNTLNYLLSFLSILESEKPMQEDLEKEIDRFENWMETYNQADYPTSFTTRDIARHFSEWQKEQNDKELSDLLTIAHLQGADQMKEQMMKGAVAVEVVGDKRDLRLIDSTQRCLFDAKRGDWLKIIIVKED